MKLGQAHGAERDTKLWENTLRGAPTSVCRTQVEVEGLTMLDLSQNNFGRGFGKEISAYIPRDNWLLGKRCPVSGGCGRFGSRRSRAEPSLQPN